MRKVSDSSRRFNFTDTRLENWPTNGREFCLFDEGKTGLVCRVCGTAKTFYYWRTDSGATIKRKIGPIGEWTVLQARAQVDKLNGQTAEAGGVVPRKDKRDITTLGDAFALYIDWHERSGGHSIYQQRRMYDLYLARFAHVRMDQIDEEWVERNVKFAVAKGDGLDEKRKKLRRSNGKPTANNVLNFMSAIYRRYLKDKKLTGKKPNPVRAVELYPKYRKEECLRDDEIPRFMDALEQYRRENCYYKHTKPHKPGIVAGKPIESKMAMVDILFIAAMSGQRRGAIAMMKWADVQLDADTPTWKIPAIKGTKSNKPKLVFLHPKIVELLRGRRERIEGEDVFPPAIHEWRERKVETESPRRIHMMNPRSVFKQVLSMARINNPRLTPHCLRAMFVTLGIASGMNLEAISATVGHDHIGTTQHYARLNDGQKLNVATKIGNLIYGNGNGDAA